ncbi:TIGR02597 family protein [Akkermansiaceae bacterium]|nr:TIGR02597 family protein [Akkermansiaceae bacterium]
MKKTLITMSALLLSAAGVNAQAFTSPVGYVTHTLKAGQFNLVGLTVHNEIEVLGDFETVSGTTLTDTDADFTSSLTAGSTYILEITSGALAGTVQEIVGGASSATSISTSDNLQVDGLAAGDTYQMRKADTLSSVFGETNDQGLLGGTSSVVADNIYISDGQGGFNIYYYSTGGFVGAGWRQVGGGSSDSSDDVVFMTDGFYILKRGSDAELVISGAVKLEAVDLAVNTDFTLSSGVYPVGSTLASTGLADSITGGTSSVVADKILIQTDSGAFDTYYYSTGGFVGIGWRAVGQGNTDVSSFELPSAFVIQRGGTADFNTSLNSPTTYTDL